MNETTEEIQCAHKTEPSPSAAGFKPFSVNPISQSFQPAISVSTSQLDEDKTNIKNSLQSRSEKNIIQNCTQYIPNLPPTSNKSTVLSVGFIQTAQTSQSQTLVLPSYKVKIRNVPDTTFNHTNSNFPLTSGGTVFYQPVSEYQFPDPRDGGFNYCNVDDNNHVDRNKPP